MTIYLLSGLINLSLTLLILSLTALVIAVTVGQVRKVVCLILTDVINLRALWVQSANDLVNNQVLAELKQKELAVTLRHRDIMLEVEADTARMPIRKERLGILAIVDEVK